MKKQNGIKAKKAYRVRVISEKGGVGKTTVSVNLSTTLANMGYKTVLGDSDLVNPAILYYFDLGDFRYASNDVYSGMVKQDEATVHFDDSKLYIIPARPTYSTDLPTQAQLVRAYKLYASYLSKNKFDFAVTDTPPGFSPAPSMAFYDLFVVVSNPTAPSAMNAVRLSRVLESLKKDYMLVCNMVTNSHTEISIKELEAVCGKTMTAVIPRDSVVDKALYERMPAVTKFPRSDFAIAINQLANAVIEKSGRLKA